MIAQLPLQTPEDPSATLPAGSAEFVMGFGFTGIAGLLAGQNFPQLGAAGPAIPANVPKNHRERAARIRSQSVANICDSQPSKSKRRSSSRRA
jgi:hypothetical protein